MGGEHRTAAFRSVVVLAALLVATWIASGWYRSQLLALERTRLGREAALRASALANALGAKFALLRGIEAHAVSHPLAEMPPREFERFVAALRSGAPSVRYFATAPDGVNRLIAPLPGNESLVAQDLLHSQSPGVRSEVARALQSEDVVLGAPCELPGGRPGLLARKAVRRDGLFWGLVSMALDLPTLLAEAGCNQVSGGTITALREDSGAVLLGSADVFRAEPIVLRIPLPEGYWELGTAPVRGWNALVRGRDLAFRAVGLTIAVLLSALTYLISSRHVALTSAVMQRTRELGTANDELHRKASERQEALAALQQSEERLRLVVENMPVMMAAFDAAGAVVAWNRECERLTGFRTEEMLGKSRVGKLLFPDADQEDCLLIGPSGDRAGSGARECRYACKDGKIGTMLWSDVSERVTIPGWARWGVGVDITDRRRVEEELRRSEAKYRVLFEANPHPMFVYDMETLAILAVNDAAASHYGYPAEEFLAMTIRDIRPPEDIPALLKRMGEITNGLDQSGVWRHRKKDGTIFLAEITSHGLEFQGRRSKLVLIADVTERRRLEEQLRQSQKMEAVGRLAGGVAHDFNNLLTVITGCTELATLVAEQGRDPVPHLRDILAAADRAADLVNHLLAFSRRQILQPRLLDLNEVLTGMDPMLRRLLGEDLEIETMCAPDLGNVLADPGRVEQIVMNLAVNARDAMPKGGKLTLETGEVYLDPEYADVHPGAQVGPHVMLAVSDTGTGMSQEVRSRLFEPFFTTKARGKGTGLGLSTVYGIVQQSGGSISVYSEPGVGSTFRVYLPRADGVHAECTAGPESSEPRADGEIILLVEDDDAVRAVTAGMLRQLGYTPLEAGSPGEALRIAREQDGPIHLLLTDVVMPEMGGKDLADAFLAVRPDVPVLYVSGYTEDAIVHHGVLDAGISFLPKPFTSRALAAKIRETLDGST